MIIAFVQIPLPNALSIEEARNIFLSTAPKYVEFKGLVRKNYILSEDGRTGGGMYLWQSKEDAARMYTEEWQEFIVEKYGSRPIISYFHSPVIVDNLSKQILSEDM
jgi:hypothetical protein